MGGFQWHGMSWRWEFVGECLVEVWCYYCRESSYVASSVWRLTQAGENNCSGKLGFFGMRRISNGTFSWCPSCGSIFSLLTGWKRARACSSSGCSSNEPSGPRSRNHLQRLFAAPRLCEPDPWYSCCQAAEGGTFFYPLLKPSLHFTARHLLCFRLVWTAPPSVYCFSYLNPSGRYTCRRCRKL